MNKYITIILLATSLFSYEKGVIDTHGGNKNKLLEKKIDFATKSIDFLLHNKSFKSKDKNISKIKYLKIDKIEDIKF